MSDRPTVLVLHSGHNNDLVYQEGLAAGFAPLGCDVIGVSVRDDHARDTAIAAVLEQPDAFLCIVSVSFYGLQLEVGGKPLQEVTSVPLVMWLFDHPAIFRKLPFEHEAVSPIKERLAVFLAVLEVNAAVQFPRGVV